MTLLLSENEVKELITMKQTLGWVEESFVQLANVEAHNEPRTRIRLAGGFFHLMSAASYVDGVVGLKAYATTSGGSQYVVQLFDAHNGQLLAIVGADLLGQIRTGAVSGIASKYLSRSNSHTVGLLGAGKQAFPQLEAVCAVRNITQVNVFSRDSERRQQFAHEAAERLDIEVKARGSAEEVVRGADIVITITSSREPVVVGDWLQEGVCVLAAGSNHWMRRELNDTAIERADSLVVDDLEQARRECGDLLWPAETGLVRWGQVHELKAIVSGRYPGRTSPEEIVVFESQGIAVSDVVVAARLVSLASERGLGKSISLA